MYKTYRCKKCDCVLFSNYYRSLGVCPECREEDTEPKDLEERLENSLQ